MGRWIVDMSQTTMSWQSSNLILIIKKRQARGQTGRTDALLSVSSPWTTHDYLTNKTLNITSIIINIIMGQQILPHISLGLTHAAPAVKEERKQSSFDETSIYFNASSPLLHRVTYWIRSVGYGALLSPSKITLFTPAALSCIQREHSCLARLG